VYLNKNFKDADAWNNLAALCYKTDDLKDALTYIEQAIKLNDTNSIYLLNKGRFQPVMTGP
jgi:hypothetical protein